MKRNSVVVGKKWKKGDGGVEAKVNRIGSPKPLNPNPLKRVSCAVHGSQHLREMFLLFIGLTRGKTPMKTITRKYLMNRQTRPTSYPPIRFRPDTR